MFERGDHVKIEVKDEATGESEWMWACVERSDDANMVLFCRLDNEPVVNTDLRLGMRFAVSCDKIREHMKSRSLKQ